jgi:hypothetical protein
MLMFLSVKWLYLFAIEYLTNNCFPERNYSLSTIDEGIRESESLKKVWKKARVSDSSSSLQWKHFRELLDDDDDDDDDDDAPYGSKERG